jgi:hypothetical protein
LTAVILILLIPTAYYIGKYKQRRADFKRNMSMQRSMGTRHRMWLRPPLASLTEAPRARTGGLTRSLARGQRGRLAGRASPHW